NALGLNFAFDLYLLLDPVGDFLKGKFYFDAQVASLHAALSATARSAKSESAAKGTTEDVAELTEDIVHVHAAAAKALASVKRLMTKLVVARLLLWIAQYFISLGREFKILLGLFVARIFVRVEFNSLLAISLFDLIGGSVLAYTQYFVK